ncbi:MAG TPA: prepilin peptidase, partial [Candidatus Saccharimonadales bacterium]|nr:prepilin peptidase [Candidatus Saccharimonadales bacterium]
MILPPGAGPVISIVLGLVFGSFANVCIHRIPEGASIVRPRSRCPACGAGIRWYDNLPVLSWILLGARCRDCGAAISWRYPLIEALMGAGFLGCYLLYGLSLDAAAAAWLVFACVALWAIDARHFILPDLLTLTGLGAGLAFALARALMRLPSAGEAAGADLLLGGILDQPPLPLASIAGAATGAAIPLLARAGYRVSRWL